MSRYIRRDIQTHGSRKYPTSALLRSSAGLGESAISAELRSHSSSETPVVAPAHFELINQIVLSIWSEMMNEAVASETFVESASLAAKLIQRHCESGSCTPIAPNPHKCDHARLRRVLGYIWVHLGDEITIEELARVACLSPFHFAHMFARAIGTPPHRYVVRMRLEKAMAEIAIGRLPLAQIALNARFSSQASFTRAFHRATGVTPGQYRRRWR